MKGFNVDVGVVPTRIVNEEGRRVQSNLEVDFVCNQGNRRYYVQSSYRMDTEEKIRQERASLMNIDDSFKKIVIVGDDIHIRRDESGIITMSIYDFLLKENAMEL
jgi:hypothetical protein